MMAFSEGKDVTFPSHRRNIMQGRAIKQAGIINKPTSEIDQMQTLLEFGGML